MNNVALSRCYKAAMAYLAVSEKRVLEGSHVQCELDFARFIMSSGIADLMRDNPPENARLKDLFPFDGDKLYDSADKLRLLCGQYYEGKTSASPGTAKGVPRSELEAINRKLDLLAGHLAKLESVKKSRERKPRLRVVKGATA
jgi:hypothetical protein